MANFRLFEGTRGFALGQPQRLSKACYADEQSTKSRSGRDSRGGAFHEFEFHFGCRTEGPGTQTRASAQAHIATTQFKNPRRMFPNRCESFVGHIKAASLSSVAPANNRGLAVRPAWSPLRVTMLLRASFSATEIPPESGDTSAQVTGRKAEPGLKARGFSPGQPAHADARPGYHGVVTRIVGPNQVLTRGDIARSGRCGRGTAGCRWIL
jgi:hypothetical protein